MSYTKNQTDTSLWHFAICSQCGRPFFMPLSFPQTPLTQALVHTHLEFPDVSTPVSSIPRTEAGHSRALLPQSLLSLYRSPAQATPSVRGFYLISSEAQVISHQSTNNLICLISEGSCKTPKPYIFTHSSSTFSTCTFLSAIMVSPLSYCPFTHITFSFLSQHEDGLYVLQRRSMVPTADHVIFSPWSWQQRVDIIRSWHIFIVGLWGPWSYL